ncbi:MAG: hypothetical protein J4F29_07425 [Candidatus Latescibacteria bacterium]|nr:hypothetical protein [Candidatus Latescibacterota bacterium]
MMREPPIGLEYSLAKYPPLRRYDRDNNQTKQFVKEYIEQRGVKELSEGEKAALAKMVKEVEGN